jgi:hypothetical protein
MGIPKNGTIGRIGPEMNPLHGMKRRGPELSDIRVRTKIFYPLFFYTFGSMTLGRRMSQSFGRNFWDKDDGSIGVCRWTGCCRGIIVTCQSFKGCENGNVTDQVRR